MHTAQLCNHCGGAIHSNNVRRHLLVMSDGVCVACVCGCARSRAKKHSSVDGSKVSDSVVERVRAHPLEGCASPAAAATPDPGASVKVVAVLRTDPVYFSTINHPSLKGS